MGRCRLVFAAVLLVLGICACSSGTGPLSTPAASPSMTAVASPSATSGITTAFAAPSIVQELGCSDGRLVWVGRSPQGAEGGIWTAHLDGSGMAAVAATAHRGSVTFTGAAGDWVVYLEAQTEQQDPRGVAWYLDAVNVTTREHVELAHSDNDTAVEIPQPSTFGTVVVWDQLTDAGTKVVLMDDLVTGTKTKLPLPADVYPVRPYLDHSQLVFLDNGPTAGEDKQIWFFRTGYVTLFDLNTHRLTRLATPVDAYYLEVAGGIGTYIVRRPTEQDTALYRIDLRAGASPVSLGPGETPMFRTSSGIITFLAEQHHMRLYRFGGATTDLPDSVQFSYAMAPCGETLYFVQGTPQLFRLSL
jgi:hypothetical protein